MTIFEAKRVCAFHKGVSLEVAGEGAAPSGAGVRDGEARRSGLSLFWGWEVTPSNKMENHSLSQSNGRLATHLIL